MKYQAKGWSNTQHEQAENLLKYCKRTREGVYVFNYAAVKKNEWPHGKTPRASEQMLRKWFRDENKPFSAINLPKCRVDPTEVIGRRKRAPSEPKREGVEWSLLWGLIKRRNFKA